MNDAGARGPVKLASHIDGDGPPLLMMHGLFGNARNWRSVQRKFSATWQVHALDLRNHGSSPWRDSMHYREMADDVLAYINDHQLGPVALLGHSMGGKVAMTMAQVAPEQLRALIVVDIAPVHYATSLRGHLNAMQTLDLTRVQSRRDADEALAQSVTDPGIRGFLLQNLVSNTHDDSTKLRWRINLAAIDKAMADLGDFDQTGPSAPDTFPVAAIYGTRSPYMDEPARQALQARFAQTRMFPIEQAGHWVHAEQPEAFNEALQTFLTALH